jgi:hypothetical protein
MLNSEIIKCEQHTKKLISYFQGHLNSIGFNGKLNEIHNGFKYTGNKQDITEISRSAACDALYLGIPNSRNFHLVNASHKEFLKNNSFEDIYRDLLQHLFSELGLYKGDYYVQSIPTLRVQSPNLNTSIVWHIDSQFGHPTDEINVWMPLTEISESTTLWFEHEGTEFKTNVDINSCLVFPWNMRHGTKINQTSYSRVSMDFRLISIDNFEKFLKKNSGLTSISRNLSFEKDYYKKYDSQF